MLQECAPWADIRRQTMMRDLPGSAIRRSVLLVILLSAAACGHSYDANEPEAGADHLQPTSTGDDPSASIEADDYARQRAAEALADRHYRSIKEWLSREGLYGESYADLATLAETAPAASKYIECHESTKSPTGPESRLELLATCLTNVSEPNLRDGTPMSAALP